MILSKQGQNQGPCTTHKNGRTPLFGFLDPIPVRRGYSPTNHPPTACCPRIQLNPDTIPQRERRTPQVQGSVTQDRPPAQMPQAQVVIAASDQPATNRRFQPPPPWERFRMALTGPGCYVNPDQRLMYQRFPRPPPWGQLICWSGPQS